MTAMPARPPRAGSTLLRRLPLIAIATVALIGAFALRDSLSFEALARNRAALLAFRDAHAVQAALGFVAVYALIVAFSLPGATVATLAGGFLFGLFPGVIYNVVAATIGAVAVFLAARAGIGAEASARIARRGGAAARLQAGLQANQWSALMVMRLVPVVPFFLANLIPAFVGVRADRFAITTLLGIIPAGLVFTSVGAGLGEVFARGDRPDLSVLVAWPVLGPILGLAGLAAVPLAVRLLRKRA